jgi:hypothetical protein
MLVFHFIFDLFWRGWGSSVTSVAFEGFVSSKRLRSMDLSYPGSIDNDDDDDENKVMLIRNFDALMGNQSLWIQQQFGRRYSPCPSPMIT